MFLENTQKPWNCIKIGFNAPCLHVQGSTSSHSQLRPGTSPSPARNPSHRFVGLYAYVQPSHPMTLRWQLQFSILSYSPLSLPIVLSFYLSLAISANLSLGRSSNDNTTVPNSLNSSKRFRSNRPRLNTNSLWDGGNAMQKRSPVPSPTRPLSNFPKVRRPGCRLSKYHRPVVV